MAKTKMNNARLNEIRKNISNLTGTMNIELREIRSYISDYPDDDYAKTIYADILKIRGELDTATDIYNEVIYNGKTHKALAAAYSGLSKIYFMNNQFDDAMECANNAIKEGYQISGSIILSRIYYHMEEYNKALKVLKLNAPEAKYNDVIRISRAKVYLALKNTESAKKELRMVQPVHNNYKIEKYYILAQTAIIESNYKEALENINKALSFDKENSDSYKNSLLLKSSILRKNGANEDAIKICENIIKTDKNLDRAYIVLGDAYMTKKNLEKACAAYSKVKNSSDLPLANIKLGEAYLAKGNYKKAMEYLLKVNTMSSKRNRNEIYYNLALISFRTQRYDSCLRILGKIDKSFISEFKEETLNNIQVMIAAENSKDIKTGTRSTYLKEQVTDYSEKRAIDHIKYYHTNSKSENRFSPEIKIEKLFDDIKEKLTNENSSWIIDKDYYIIQYPNIGYSHEEEVRELEVVTLPNSKKIISMYPISSHTYDVELDKSLENSQNSKVKRLSQIEKFYKRYGK